MNDVVDFRVPLTSILAVNPHPNADRLELATVYGFQVVVQKDRYHVGDKVIYVPMDSILPSYIEEVLFPAGSKIVLHNHRVRQIKIRSFPSQGMIIDLSDLEKFIDFSGIPLGEDFSRSLGIIKYEPPQSGPSSTIGKGRNRNKRYENPLFHKYNGLNHLKWFPNLFTEGEQVVVQEKLHGSNSRVGSVPYIANTWWKKVKCYFGWAPEYEYCYGSNNVEISAARSYKGWYGEDIYGECFREEGAFKKVKPGEIFYGEIIGPNIQKGYDYSLSEHHFVVFDIKVLQPEGKYRWLNPSEVQAICIERGFEYVPVLYVGPYSKEKAEECAKGPSVYDPNTKVREGCVIKAAENYDVEGNKKALRLLNEDYLDDKTNTDFH